MDGIKVGSWRGRISDLNGAGKHLCLIFERENITRAISPEQAKRDMNRLAESGISPRLIDALLTNIKYQYPDYEPPKRSPDAGGNHQPRERHEGFTPWSK